MCQLFVETKTSPEAGSGNGEEEDNDSEEEKGDTKEEQGGEGEEESSVKAQSLEMLWAVLMGFVEWQFGAGIMDKVPKCRAAPKHAAAARCMSEPSGAVQRDFLSSFIRCPTLAPSISAYHALLHTIHSHVEHRPMGSLAFGFSLWPPLQSVRISLLSVMCAHWCELPLPRGDEATEALAEDNMAFGATQIAEELQREMFHENDLVPDEGRHAKARRLKVSADRGEHTPGHAWRCRPWRRWDASF